MISVLLWIIGLYAAVAACAYGWARRRRQADRQHYVLVAGNHQREIEGYVRKLQWQAQRLGREFGITVLLAPDSYDETAAIVEKFARGETGIGLVRQSVEASEDHRSKEEWERAWESESPTSGPQQWIWVELPAAGEAKGPRR
ncbi:hypothetical protein [Cohnella nanjingensis]|uniref:Uncharacterized protein n=1 Tax=Cohnella nanjingensis TaxID=1387779 RepID=A0A7X0RQI2_9BACL|nr:hypothetical protein [Cohnella nanjingensis]MBB6670636.1 hypothetical protein [Cohnella nanjingensis]